MATNTNKTRVLEYTSLLIYCATLAAATVKIMTSSLEPYSASKVGRAQEEHYLLSKRDEFEGNRLNSQHKYCVRLQGDHVLHPSIPKENIRKIADVATGTGIWLEDVAAELFKAGNNGQLELVGFDVADTLFTRVNPAGVKLVISDIHEGFPEEYHGTFDVVHLRLLLVVITEEQMPNAVSNLVKLLKPGGHLQWDDLDFQDNTDRLYPTSVDGSGSMREVGEMVLGFFKSQGWSIHIMDSISKALKGCPVEDERRTDYTQVAYLRPELGPELVQWHKEALMAVMVPVMLRSGRAKNKEEAEAQVDAYHAKVDGMAKKGVVFPMPMVTLVARKKA